MHTKKLFALAATAVLLATSAHAAGTANNGASVAPRQSDTMAGGPFGTRAKVAVLHSGIVGTVRSKNVTAVSSPSTGIYCITPAVALDLTKTYPSVSVEWGWSSGSSLAAFVRDTGDGFTSCAAGDLEVQTYDLTGTASAAVAFLLQIE